MTRLPERPQLESRRGHSRSQLRGSRPPPEPDASVLRGLTAAAMPDPMGEADTSTLRLDFCRVGEARRARRGAGLGTPELSRCSAYYHARLACTPGEDRKMQWSMTGSEPRMSAGYRLPRAGRTCRGGLPAPR